MNTCHRRWLCQVEKSEDTHEPRDHIVISEFFSTFRYHIEARTGRLQLSRGPDDVGSNTVTVKRNPGRPEEESAFKVDPGTGTTNRPDVTWDSWPAVMDGATPGTTLRAQRAQSSNLPICSERAVGGTKGARQP